MVVAARARPSAFHVMAKPTGAVCNLDCDYCYFLSKSALYPGSSFRMSDRVLEVYLRQLFQAHRHASEVVVSFQGGEPTMMGLDFFRRALRVERRYALPGQHVVHTLQTNGTLLDDEWGAFLHENDFLVGLSIDGPREMHDAYRVDKGGKPTFDRVVRGLDVLRRHHVDWNALTTVHAANGDHGSQVYRFLRDDLGATFVQLIPIVERVTAEVLPLAEAGWGERAGHRPLYRQEGDRVTHRSVGARQYGQFLVDVFDEWVRHDVGRVFVQMFDTALGHWLGHDQAGMCVHAVTCGGAVALEHTGDVYSCDHYVEPDFRLGSLADGDRLVDLVGSASQVAFGRAKADSLPSCCRGCPVLFACNGGCPKDRFDVGPDGEAGLSHLCEGYRLFFAHVEEPMRVMADLVGRGEPAAGVMQWCAERDSRRTTGDSG